MSQWKYIITISFFLFILIFVLGIIEDIWTEHNTGVPHHLFIGVLHPEYQYRLVQEEPTNL